METLLKERYQLVRELGQGGMGVVYQGYDVLLERQVAIKILSESSQARLGTDGRVRLLHEAQSAARLNHPNIVSIYDAGEQDSRPFIIMELIEGHSLYENRPKSLPEILSIAQQICAGLQHAHQNGIIHRDLKPENILVTGAGLVKLTDFGLARSISSRMTYDGMIVGTVLYLSPEAALRQPFDHRTDLYALGVILYELVAGCLPYMGEEPLAVISQHLYAPIVPPRACNPEIPAELDALIVSLMSKKPEDRPSSAAEVARILSSSSVVNGVQNLIDLDLPTPGLLDRIIRGRLIGREREFAELENAWRLSANGKGSVLLVSGEPGIGKTRLARELTARTLVSGGQVLSGACYSEGEMPYAPFPRIIQEALESQKKELSLPEYVLPELLRLAPLLKSRYPRVAPAATLDSLGDQTRTFDCIGTLIAAIANQAPVLLFIDDIHWADSSTLKLLRHLVHRCQEQRVLILLTYREVELDESRDLNSFIHELVRERLSTRIKLFRLDRSQTQSLLEAMLSPTGVVHATLLDSIYHETEGNPFFIEEICKTLIEEDRLAFTAGQWFIKDPDSIVVPQSVRVTLQTRLARLPQASQDVLRMAAVFGKEFDARLLQKALELEDEPLIQALEAAEHAQIIGEIPTHKSSTAYSFAHNLIASTLRDNMNSLRRRQLHLQAALAYEQLKPQVYETLAYHFEQAGKAEQALKYYRLAANRALSLFANKEAERWFRSALEISEAESPDPQTLSGLAEALFMQSRYDEAMRAWEQACQLYQSAGEFDLLARTCARRARAAWYTRNPPLSLKICLECLQSIPDYLSLESAGIATLIHETARAYRFNNQPEHAISLCERALELSRKLNLVEVEAETLSTMGILPNLSPEKMRASLEAAVQLSEKEGLMSTAIRAHVNYGEYMRYLGEFEAALNQLDRARFIAEKMGARSWQFELLVSVAEINFDLSNFSAIEATLPILERLLTDLPEQDYFKLAICSLQARLNRFLGNWELAIQQLSECLANSEQLQIDWLSTSFTVTLADLYYERGQLAQAWRALASRKPVIEQNPTIDPIIHAALSSAIRIQQGLVEEARQLLATAEAIVERHPSVLGQAYLLYTRARWAAIEKHYDAAIQFMEQLAENASQMKAYWYQGRILTECARIYQARRSRSDLERARQLLAQARVIYRRLNLPIYTAYVADLIGETNELLAIEEEIL
jgi:predicted ATPase/predicted Ser/Thr protein kinase